MKNLILILFLVMLPLTLASDTQHRFKVCVVLSGDKDDAGAVMAIDRYVKRELRLLGDVDVVDSAGDWHYILKFCVASGEKTYAIAIYQGSRFPKSAYARPVMYTALPATLCWQSDLGVAICGKAQLSEFCQVWVGGFDKHLQSQRSWR